MFVPFMNMCLCVNYVRLKLEIIIKNNTNSNLVVVFPKLFEFEFHYRINTK